MEIEPLPPVAPAPVGATHAVSFSAKLHVPSSGDSGTTLPPGPPDRIDRSPSSGCGRLGGWYNAIQKAAQLRAQAPFDSETAPQSGKGR